MFRQGVDNSKLELEKTYDLLMRDFNNKVLQAELDFRLGTMIHWIMAYWERARRTYPEIPDDTNSLFSAFSFANNQMKHEVKLTKLTQISGGFSFPISFPLSIPPIEFIWHLNSENQTGFENQEANYKKHLENRVVMETITKAIEILKEYKIS